MAAPAPEAKEVVCICRDNNSAPTMVRSKLRGKRASLVWTVYTTEGGPPPSPEHQDMFLQQAGVTLRNNGPVNGDVKRRREASQQEPDWANRKMTIEFLTN